MEIGIKCKLPTYHLFPSSEEIWSVLVLNVHSIDSTLTYPGKDLYKLGARIGADRKQSGLVHLQGPQSHTSGR